LNRIAIDTMAGLSDIEEVEENKSVVTATHAVERRSFHSGDDVSEAPTKNSRAPSVMVSIDPSMLSMVSMVHNEMESADDARRRSRLCCGSCCDFVRACLVVDVIYISVLAFINISQWFFPSLVWDELGTRIKITDEGEGEGDGDGDIQTGSLYDDDFMDDMFNDMAQEEATCYFCTTVIQNVLGMALALIGAIGAWKFQKYMVLVAGIWFCIDAILFCIFQNYASGLWVLGYAYPHFGLFLALRSGKMTRENYYVSEQHCCGRDCDRDDDSDSDCED